MYVCICGVAQHCWKSQQKAKHLDIILDPRLTFREHSQYCAGQSWLNLNIKIFLHIAPSTDDPNYSQTLSSLRSPTWWKKEHKEPALIQPWYQTKSLDVSTRFGFKTLPSGSINRCTINCCSTLNIFISIFKTKLLTTGL